MVTLSMNILNTGNVFAASEVIIPDTNLHNAITDKLEMPTGSTLTTDDMEKLTSLSNYSYSGSSDIYSLEGLQYATNLSGLFISNSTGNETKIAGLNIISQLPKLKSLTLTGTMVDDLSFLQGNTTITGLCLNENKITDISVLASMPQLTRLQINGSLTNGIGNNRGDSSDGNSFSDLSPLSGLTNLTELEINGQGDAIEDISALANLTNLRSLKLEQNNIKDMSVIANFTKLNSLEIRDNKITNVPDLSKLTTITWLAISDNPGLTNTDVEKIGALTTLTSLSLSGDLGWQDSKQITDISPLAHLTKLSSLVAARASISDLTPLSELNLKRAVLSNNIIEDVSPLSGKTFYYLDLRKNQITDVSSLDTAGATFFAQDQAVTLADVYLGSETAITIAGINNVVPGLTWNTAGTYNNNKLVWSALGNNQVSFASTDASFTGTIKQNVVNAPVPAPATLTVGNDITIFEKNSYDVLTDVSAVDYDSADLTAQVTYAITNASGQSVSSDVSQLAAGTYTITYSVTGKTGDAVTAAKTLTVLPTPVIDDIYEDETTLNGTAMAGLTVEITCPHGNVTTVTTDANGAWTMPTDGVIKKGDVFTAVATHTLAGTSRAVQTIVKPVVYTIDANDVTMTVGQLQTLRQNGTLEAYVLEQAGANAAKTSRSTTSLPVHGDMSPLANVNQATVVQVTTYVPADPTMTTYDATNSLIEKPINVTVTDTSGSEDNTLPNTGQNAVLFILTGMSLIAASSMVLTIKKKKTYK